MKNKSEFEENINVPKEERPIFISFDEEEWHKQQGHKKKWRWHKSKRWVSGPNQTKELVLVTKTPRYDSNFSTTVPKSWSEKWYLECGHSIMPIKKNPYAATWNERKETVDPHTVTEKQFCSTCTHFAGHWEETKTKQYYWEEKHSHSAKEAFNWMCNDCGLCIICQGHKPKCLGPSREYLQECLHEQCGAPRDDNFSDGYWDIMKSLIDLLTPEQLNEAIGWYTE